MSLRAAGLIAAALITACDAPKPEVPAASTTAPKLDVRALSFPAEWLVRRIAGDAVTLTTVCPPGEDPPTWQPGADLVADLAHADLLVANGANYEAWLTTVSLPNARLLRAADGLDVITLPGVTHSHGQQGSHSHAGLDPHTWGDPILFKQEAQLVHDRLVSLDPDHTAAFDAGMATLATDLDALDKELAQALAPAKGRRLAASHPAFNYLARRYGLDLTSFGLDPEGAADADAAAAVSAWVATAGAHPLLLWEAPPSDVAVAALPTAVRHVQVDPLEQPGPDGVYDYLARSRTNAAVFAGLFAPADASRADATP